VDRELEESVASWRVGSASGLSGLWGRVLWYPRAPSSEVFLSMFSVVGVVSHPIPFDGSTTSADHDAIAVGVPYVTVTCPSVNLCCCCVVHVLVVMVK
jgi:hypothetical protein